MSAGQPWFRRSAGLSRRHRGRRASRQRTVSHGQSSLQARGGKQLPPFGRRRCCNAAAAAMSHAGERSLLGAECARDPRRPRDPLARSGQQAGVTQRREAAVSAAGSNQADAAAAERFQKSKGRRGPRPRHSCCRSKTGSRSRSDQTSGSTGALACIRVDADTTGGRERQSAVFGSARWTRERACLL
jgi:hypothetical protein